MKDWYTLYSNILYLHFSEGFYNLPESAKNAASPGNLVMRLLRMAGYTLVRLLGNLFKTVEKPEQLQDKVWLYVVSQNNYDSLHFLEAAIPDAVMVAGQSKAIGRYNQAVARISLRKKLLYYYKFLPLFFQFLAQRKHRTLRFVDLLYDAVGFYEVYLQKLKKYRPQAIVFANDHNADARALLLAAKELGIPTIYVQHSSVSHLFPPLAFNLSLLEGQDSLDKYKLCGPVTGRVEFIGMPKADKFVLHRNRSKQVKTLGIACNLMDLTEEVQQLVRNISRDFPELRILLRPHPRDKRSYTFATGISPNITLTTPRQQSVFEYLQGIDMLVSGNSGIHLEAVLLNVWSVYYNFNPKEELHDYYGFVAQGLIEEAISYDALRPMIAQGIAHKPEVYRRASYYHATVGTEYDGRSGELASTFVKAMLSGGSKL
ncbi:glycosyltransferase family protein [Pontibacter ramchanderi]|uniref:CDP-glycerol:poly(Glycerophosphate) glycerophosphotransferase n=1 Tax=Pontibacter ramchanderi TaxID=1179743 RepID=A0A2N3U7J4_9BACT|nr:hypothetical protein [Pontibacter ramchanderi]PKV62706.1 hypothetical protein BD749_3590 [Pontibacter ramchanderi]